ncbi:serine threonine kinase [Fusarium pseudocircinatum]|uniref:Serine threonine kinase n=1 Tax=Fusarium pseudocircinatum TaxID=56676 RepID=A0A8H5LBK4_9HYPO|nr:serine threonine kinase [Fusarium pseudocircinatum]
MGDFCLLDRADPPYYDFGDSPKSIFDVAEVIKPGGSSQVSRVRIHPSCFLHYDGEEKRDVAFAVKKIYSQNSWDFARERDAYRRMNLAQNPHPHIVPLLASYRMEGRYHFVFPLADWDLAMYWRSEPKPSNDRRTLEWFGGQLRGLADAVSMIHGQKDQERDVYGVHGDIKPENILCFGSNDSERWTAFALSDFGSSYFCTAEERNIPHGLKHTPAYRAPEIDTTTLGITQAYDIWSLGCVFAEAITWFYEGRTGIAKLIHARLDEERNSPNRDAFFYVKDNFTNRGGLSAKLKPEIQRLLVSLRRSSRSSLFMDDMLYIVLEGMLKVNVSERMSALEVLDALTRMCLKLENDPAYSESRLNSNVEMVHTQHARQRLDRTVDATHYTNVTTQSDTSAQISLKPRFACPYHKAGILVSVHHRACEGPGWIDVNKVKEHLFRCHLPKKYRGKHTCRRCDTSFETDELLLDHQHQETPCPKRKPEAIYGMLSREQAARLRSLKRKSSKESEEDRWFDIYRIAFPTFNRMLENISPYHESNNTSLSTINSTSSNGISQYKDYLLNRDAEEYAAKLAKLGIHVTLEAAAKLLKLQVKDLERFDGTMREPVQAYRFETYDSREKTSVEGGAPAETAGSSDFFGSMQLVARYTDDKAY